MPIQYSPQLGDLGRLLARSLAPRPNIQDGTVLRLISTQSNCYKSAVHTSHEVTNKHVDTFYLSNLQIESQSIGNGQVTYPELGVLIKVLGAVFRVGGSRCLGESVSEGSRSLLFLGAKVGLSLWVEDWRGLYFVVRRMAMYRRWIDHERHSRENGKISIGFQVILNFVLLYHPSRPSYMHPLSLLPLLSRCLSS